MFNLKQKQEYLNGNKKYIKKGQEQSHHIGKLVKIDWDANTEQLVDKISSLSELDDKTQKWANDQEVFVVTNTNYWGISSTLELDNRFCVSPYQLVDIETGEYIWKKLS